MGQRSIRVLRWIGTSFVSFGLLVLAFVVYQLWGTNIQEARSQDRLRSQFEALVAAPSTPTTTTTRAETTTTGSTSSTVATVTTAPSLPTTTLAPPAPVAEGQPIARIEIPKIGVDRIVVSGVSVDDLKKGPGHYAETPLPGQLGNAAIAGHRTTFGAPFYRIDELAPGDEIIVTITNGARYRYLVSADPRIVAPTDVSVLDQTTTATLTLTSCHPRRSARQRIVISAALDPGSSAEPTPFVPPTVGTAPVVTSDSTVSGATTTVAVTAPRPAVTPTSITELSAGWFADSGAWLPSIGFGLVVIAVVVAARRLTRRARWFLVYPAATIPFVVVLYFFFENVSRLLPPNI